MVGGAVECTVAVAIGGVDVGVRLEQQLGDVNVAVPRREDQRRVAICAYATRGVAIRELGCAAEAALERPTSRPGGAQWF